jgi:hypothetical protein
MIGGYNEKILYYSIEDEYLEDPHLVRFAKFSECVTCIKPLDEEHYLIG